MKGVGIALGVFVLAYAASPWRWRGRWQLTGGVVAGALLVGIGRGLGFSWSDLGLTGGAFRPGSWSTDAGTLGFRLGHVAAGLLKCLVYAGLAAAGALIVSSLLLAARDLGRRGGGTSGSSWIPRYGLVELLFATVVVEELAFRGVILTALTEPRVRLGGVLFSCVLFGLWHLRPRRGWTADQWKRGARKVVPIAVLAFPLALARLMTGSVVAPAAVHYSADFIRKLVVERSKQGQ
jgi:membrane protease YdiL (CAAX protease family)